MRDKPVLVIDAGTSALRAVSVDACGNAERVKGVPWGMFRPPDASEYARELEGAEVEASLLRLLHAASAPGDSFGAVAFTGQREGLVFVDERGAALLVSPNVDARAAAEGIAIDAADAAGVYSRTGHLPSLLMAPAKRRWLEAHRREAAERVTQVMPLADWLASLISELRVSRSLMCEVGLVGLDGCATGPDSSVVVPDGSIIGTARLGVPRADIVLAGADTQCGVLGAGVADEGSAVVAGWSAPVQRVMSKPLLDQERRTWTGLHVMPERWVIESNAGDTGRAWGWVCEMLAVSAQEGDELASTVRSGSSDALMMLGRAPMNAGAMTAGVGAITFPLPLAMWSLERAELLRATLEAAAYAIRANIEQLEEIGSVRIDAPRLGGGMSRSMLFAQILADVLDRPIEVARSPETTALGAAMLAFVAQGVYSSMDEAVAAMAEPRTVVEPNLRDSATYEDCYARWRLLVAHMEQAP